MKWRVKVRLLSSYRTIDLFIILIIVFVFLFCAEYSMKDRVSGVVDLIEQKQRADISAYGWNSPSIKEKNEIIDIASNTRTRSFLIEYLNHNLELDYQVKSQCAILEISSPYIGKSQLINILIKYISSDSNIRNFGAICAVNSLSSTEYIFQGYDNEKAIFIQKTMEFHENLAIQKENNVTVDFIGYEFYLATIEMAINRLGEKLPGNGREND